MRKLQVLVLVLAGMIVVVSSGGFAQERALFLDETEGNLFTPIQAFLYSVPTYDLVLPDLRLLRIREGQTGRPDFPDAGFDLLFWGYQLDDLLMFEAYDLFRSQKILGMVRPVDDHQSMIQDLTNRLSQIFSLHRETKLIFSRQEQGTSSVVLSTIDGKEQTTLFSLSQASINDLWMSADTRFLVFTTDRYYTREICRYNLETMTLQELVGGESINRYPYPLPNHRQIVFWSDRNGMDGIYRMNEDGSTQRLLFSSTYPLREPAVSPDGHLLAYGLFRNGQWNLQLHNLLSSSSRLMPFDGNVSFPRFSIDGKKIIFVGEAAGNHDLYILDLAHDTIQRLTYDSIPKEYPSFSPDGKWVVYSGRKEVSWDVFLVSPDDRLIHRVTSSRADDRFPSFTPYPVY